MNMKFIGEMIQEGQKKEVAEPLVWYLTTLPSLTFLTLRKIKQGTLQKESKIMFRGPEQKVSQSHYRQRSPCPILQLIWALTWYSVWYMNKKLSLMQKKDNFSILFIFSSYIPPYAILARSNTQTANKGMAVLTPQMQKLWANWFATCLLPTFHHYPWFCILLLLINI